MNLEIEKVKLSSKDVKKTYKEERMSFIMMVLLTKITHTDFLAFYDKNPVMWICLFCNNKKYNFYNVFGSRQKY